MNENTDKIEQYTNAIYAYVIYKLYDVLTNKLKEYNSLELFNNIEMPLVPILANMQYNGMLVKKQ